MFFKVIGKHRGTLDVAHSADHLVSLHVEFQEHKIRLLVFSMFYIVWQLAK